jgi:hypothetical protein
VEHGSERRVIVPSYIEVILRAQVPFHIEHVKIIIKIGKWGRGDRVE